MTALTGQSIALFSTYTQQQRKYFESLVSHVADSTAATNGYPIEKSSLAFEVRKLVSLYIATTVHNTV
jgi:hypothetical protein